MCMGGCMAANGVAWAGKRTRTDHVLPTCRSALCQSQPRLPPPASGPGRTPLPPTLPPHDLLQWPRGRDGPTGLIRWCRPCFQSSAYPMGLVVGGGWMEETRHESGSPVALLITPNPNLPHPKSEPLIEDFLIQHHPPQHHPLPRVRSMCGLFCQIFVVYFLAPFHPKANSPH